MARTRWSPCAVVAGWAPARSSSGSDTHRAAGSAVAIAVALAVAVALGGCTFRAASDDTPTVVRVVDGDTVVIDVGGTDERVRLIGIDTPESVDPRQPVECYGKEASRRLGELLPERTRVRVELDAEARDRYGRLLAYVYRSEDDLFVNRTMLAEGYAQVLTIPPNVAHADDFVAVQRDARDEGRGLWSACPHE